MTKLRVTIDLTETDQKLLQKVKKKFGLTPHGDAFRRALQESMDSVSNEALVKALDVIHRLTLKLN